MCFCIIDVKERKPQPSRHPQVISLAAEPDVRSHRHIKRPPSWWSAEPGAPGSGPLARLLPLKKLSRCGPEQETAYLGVSQVPRLPSPPFPSILQLNLSWQILGTVSSQSLHGASSVPPHKHPSLSSFSAEPSPAPVTEETPSSSQETALPVGSCKSWRPPLSLGIRFSG